MTIYVSVRLTSLLFEELITNTTCNFTLDDITDTDPARDVHEKDHSVHTLTTPTTTSTTSTNTLDSLLYTKH